MKRILHTLTLGGLLLLGGALAQNGADTSGAMTFGEFDTSGDAQIDQAEFDAAFGAGGLYGRFDAGMTGAVDQAQFASGLFEVLDTDMSGSLSESELAGLSTWGSSQTLADLDTDGDGEVSQAEFEQGFDASGVFANFDADASGDVSEAEFNQGIYTVLDTGPEIQGRDLDIYMWNCDEAVRFGRKTVTVTVLRRGWANAKRR